MAVTKKIRKGRMTSAERDFKQSEGKKLYILGLSLLNISELIDVGEKTLRGWRDGNGWEDEKELNTIRPSEIKNLILQYVVDIKNGKTPLHKADDLSKISAAFDRLDDNRKKAVYAMESLDDFSGFIMKKAGFSKGKKREELLELLKEVRPFFDEYIGELLSHD